MDLPVFFVSFIFLRFNAVIYLYVIKETRHDVRGDFERRCKIKALDITARLMLGRRKS